MATFSCSCTQFQWRTFPSWFLLGKTAETVPADWLNLFASKTSLWDDNADWGVHMRLLIALKILDQTPQSYHLLSCLHIYKHVCALSGYSKGAAHGGARPGVTQLHVPEQALSRGAWRRAGLGALFFTLMDISLMNLPSPFFSALKSVCIDNEVEMQRTIYRFGDFVCSYPSTIKQNVQKEFPWYFTWHRYEGIILYTLVEANILYKVKDDGKNGPIASTEPKWK